MKLLALLLLAAAPLAHAVTFDEFTRNYHKKCELLPESLTEKMQAAICRGNPNNCSSVQNSPAAGKLENWIGKGSRTEGESGADWRFELLGASYRGIPVKSLSMTMGMGFGGTYLNFDLPPADLRRRLALSGLPLKKGMELKVGGEGKSSWLGCEVDSDAG